MVPKTSQPKLKFEKL